MIKKLIKAYYVQKRLEILQNKRKEAERRYFSWERLSTYHKEMLETVWTKGKGDYISKYANIERELSQAECSLVLKQKEVDKLKEELERMTHLYYMKIGIND